MTTGTAQEEAANATCACKVSICRCVPCKNRITQEDLLCDDCRAYKSENDKSWISWHCHKSAPEWADAASTEDADLEEINIDLMEEARKFLESREARELGVPTYEHLFGMTPNATEGE